MKPAIGTFNTLADFRLAYFDGNKKTAGERNPVRKQDARNSLNKQRKALEKEIKEGIHNPLLNTCAVTGDSGTYGQTVRAALIKVEKDGIESAYRVLVGAKVRRGTPFKGGKVVNVSRRGMRAKVTVAQIGNVVKPTVMVTG